MLFLWLTVISLIALIYPYVIYPLVLRVLAKHRINPSVSAAQLTSRRAALLFCAHNEEIALPAKIRNIREIKKIVPSVDVHTYTDGCTDNSANLLREAEDVLTVHEGHTRIGKASGMRILVDAATADILIFTDANVYVEPKSVARLVSYFDNPEVGTVAGTLHYTNAGDSTAALTGSMYWKLEEAIKRLESETGSTMGADGSLFATRRSIYPVVPPNLLDDMIASISPLFVGLRVISASDVRAFELATVSSADEFRRKRRIACRAFNTHRYLKPRLASMTVLNKFKYLSHKYIRWFSAIFVLLSLAFGLGTIAAFGGAVSAVMVAGGVGALWVAARRFEIPVISSATEIVVSMCATGLGVCEAMIGRDYQVWAPARSGSGQRSIK